MNGKIEELRRRANRLSDEYNAIRKEISRIEDQLLAENAELYKGKWLYKKDSNWNEFDDEYTEYRFICITGVQLKLNSNPEFSAIRIDTDNNYRMQGFSFCRIESMTLEEVREYTEFSDVEKYRLENSLKTMLEELFMAGPCLKEKLKNLFE